MTKGVSIIVSTFNGSGNLYDTIQHIAAQQLPPGTEWELIIVDNNSSDNSAEVAQQAWETFGPAGVGFKVITEKKPGKLYALQYAIKEAVYEYLVICDDDNWLAPDYTKRAYDLLDSRPEVGAMGGRGIPETKGVALPDWFKAFAVGSQAPKTGIMKPRAVLWGAGMCTKRSLYLKMYERYDSFLPECKEFNIIFAEDTEYCMRLLLKGYRIYYDDNLIYHHYIPERKLNKEFLEGKQIREFKESDVVLRKYTSAMRAVIKTRNRPDIWLFLLLITPFNYLFSFSERRKEKAKLTLYHLLPFEFKVDSISKRLKAFIKESNSNNYARK
jgi:glycosyltransferase involved in cell wall biosynthesis